MATRRSVTKTISAENTFTDAIQFAGQSWFYLSITDAGTSCTITLQVSGDNSTWRDVTDADGNVIEYTSVREQVLIFCADGTLYWRLGVKTGDYGSGTPDVELGQSIG